VKIVCVGGGPAGLYFAISAKLRDPGHQIIVLERDPPMATYGWGVVYWDPLLDMLYRNDPESAREINACSVLWQDQQIRVIRPDKDGTAFFNGYGYSMGRAALLDILSRRAAELGVEVRYGCQVQSPSELPEADLVVASDGAGSRIRKLHGGDYGTQVEQGRNPYIWLGTDKVFSSFVFCFEETPAGWVWFHAYPSVEGVSTCIVECSPETWRGLGLDQVDAAEGVRLLEKIFDRPLEGHSLISSSRGEPAQWQTFAHVTNQKWYHGRTVLAGDAAHTTHFTLGSGTWMAMIDAVVLAHSLWQYPDVDEALREYDRHRRAEMQLIQGAARTSMVWFEHLEPYLDLDPMFFSYAMAVRHGNHSPARYRAHLAIQIAPVRWLLRAFDSVRRWYMDRRRRKAARRPWDRPGLPAGGSAASAGSTAKDAAAAGRRQ
jgi:anthraniloyl-CoA monooxygenase